jgi:3-deoxy-manno-octulosonate cytidylyltransferase (CMP-KDO synthetase)
MDLAIIVPGRLASTRFPQKLLHEINGTPLIVLTARRIQSQTPDIPLFFAVDHPLLESALKQAGFETIMTREDHSSGTDRIAEANATIGAEHVINVQADEPLVTARQILQLSKLIHREGMDLATVAHRFHKAEDFHNSNQVKVVISGQGEALYFSRSPIPYPRDLKGIVTDNWLADNPCYRHLGLYAYTRNFLNAFTQLPPSYLETTEKLEQLRALENGFHIAIGITDEISIGIDTPEDAALLIEKLRV